MSTLAMVLTGSAALFALAGAIFTILAASPANDSAAERTLLTFALSALVISIGCAAAGGLA